MFGGFKYFLYLCIINQGLKKAEAATRRSSSQEVSDTIKNTTKWQEMKSLSR
jgi:hypothetical protein